MANATTDLGTLFVSLKVKDQATKQLEDVGKKIKVTGADIQKVGSNFTKYLSVPLMGFGGLAIKEFADFEGAMAKVQATTGASGTDMAKLTEKARDLGKTTKFSATEVSEAMNYMAMAGWDTTQVMDGLDGVLDLASASGEDLAKVSDIVTDSLTGFGMSAEDTNGFVDLLANTSRNANTNVSLLGESFKYVAPVAGSLGISAEDTALALGLMANAGIKGSQAGTSLRATILALTSPTKKAAKLMKEYGIEIAKSEDGSIDLEGTLDNIKKATGNLDKEQQANILTQIVGREAMSGLSAILNTSEEDYDKLKEATSDYNGVAKEMANTMNNTVKGNLNKLKSAFSELLIVVGENLIPIFTKVVEKVTKVVEWFGNLDEGTQNFIIKMGLLAVAIGPVVSIVGKLVSGVTPLVGLFTGAGTAVSGTAGALGSAGLLGAIGPLLPILGTVAGVVGVVGTAFAVWNKHATETAVMDFSSTVKQIDGLSEATQNMIIETKEGYDNLKDVSQAYFNGEIEDQKVANQAIQEELDAHFITIIEKQNANYEEQTRNLIGFKATLSEEEQKFIDEQLSKTEEGHNLEKEQTLAYYEEATALLEGFESGKIQMTEENMARYNELLDLMMSEEIEANVTHGAELNALKQAEYQLQQSATAENASKVISIAEDRRQKLIETAEAEYQAQEDAILGLEGITEENRAKMLEIARGKKDEAVKIANEEKSLVVQTVGDQYDDMYKTVDLKTGEINGKNTQAWKKIASNQDDEIRKMNQDLGLGFQKAGDAVEKETGKVIMSVDDMGDRFDANSMTITEDLDTIKKRVEDYGKKAEENAKKATKAMEDHAKNTESANEKTGKSADKAGEKVDKLREKYEKMGKEPNINKTITITEKVNKAPKSAFTNTAPKTVGRRNSYNAETQPLNIRALTGFNPSFDGQDRVGFNNVTKDTAKETSKELVKKLDKLIEVTEVGKEIDVYLDKYTLVGSITGDISRALAKGVRM